jgi:hypothetical protein
MIHTLECKRCHLRISRSNLTASALANWIVIQTAMHRCPGELLLRTHAQEPGGVDVLIAAKDYGKPAAGKRVKA